MLKSEIKVADATDKDEYVLKSAAQEPAEIAADEGQLEQVLRTIDGGEFLKKLNDLPTDWQKREMLVARLKLSHGRGEAAREPRA